MARRLRLRRKRTRKPNVTQKKWARHINQIQSAPEKTNGTLITEKVNKKPFIFERKSERRHPQY
jgi:hypothetical protein